MAPPGFSFFSKPSKPNTQKTGSSVVVTARVVQRPAAGSSSSTSKAVARQSTPQTASPSRSASASQSSLKKRKDAANLDAVHPPLKKSRISPSPEHSRAPSLAPSLFPSATSSRHSSLAPVADEDLSRAGSSVPEIAVHSPRECWSEEDGKTQGLLSCEEVVRDMVKTYKACE